MGHQDTPDPPGTLMLSTATLAQEFGVATRTVRKALAPLAAEGLIETRPGWGPFVARTAAGASSPPRSGRGSRQARERASRAHADRLG